MAPHLTPKSAHIRKQVESVPFRLLSVPYHFFSFASSGNFELQSNHDGCRFVEFGRRALRDVDWLLAVCWGFASRDLSQRCPRNVITRLLRCSKKKNILTIVYGF